LAIDHVPGSFQINALVVGAQHQPVSVQKEEDGRYGGEYEEGAQAVGKSRSHLVFDVRQIGGGTLIDGRLTTYPFDGV